MSNFREWQEWFTKQNLGELEPYREDVEYRSLENAGSHEGWLQRAKDTVNYYLGDPECLPEYHKTEGQQ